MTDQLTKNTHKKKGYAKCWNFFIIVIAFILI